MSNLSSLSNINPNNGNNSNNNNTNNNNNINNNNQNNESNTGIANVHAAKVLLHAFEQAENNFELKKELLYTLRDIFVLDTRTSKFARLGTLKPFQCLFQHFNPLPTKTKSLLLMIFEEVITKGELQLDEIKACCDILKGMQKTKKK